MPTSYWIALSGVIPALILMWIVDRADAKRPEPRRTRRLAAFAGMLSVIPALILELVISGQTVATIEPQTTFQGSAFQAYVVAAAVEEACKFALVYWLVWRRPELDERMDGIVYAGRAGLGFALVENVIYLLQQPSLGGQVVVWVARALLAVPGHAMWSGMIGAMAARRRFERTGLGLLGGFLLAVAFHGTYDLSVFVQLPLHLTGHEDARHALMIAPVVLTVLAFVVVRSMTRTALHLDDAEAATLAAQSVHAPTS